LLIIGLTVIVVIGFLFAFLIAALAAILVWLRGYGLFLAGVTFLVVALISAAVVRGWRAKYRQDRVIEHEHNYEHGKPNFMKRLKILTTYQSIIWLAK
jgi:membrane protein implicated in regulation of membrane protease activity